MILPEDCPRGHLHPARQFYPELALETKAQDPYSLFPTIPLGLALLCPVNSSRVFEISYVCERLLQGVG